jgi:transmembrane sensor
VEVADFFPSGDTHTRIRHVSPQDIERKLSWTDGTLSFSGETLAEAAAEFNRYNVRQMVIVDPAIRDLRVGGIFATTDPEAFAVALTASSPMKLVPPDKTSPASEQIRLGLDARD